MTGQTPDLNFRMPDYGLGGFFPQLKNAQDLFAKLERDLERLKASPADATVAFDFFVTANHLVDWRWPGDSRMQSNVRQNDVIPRICEHLANGAKHFILNREHYAVQHADIAPATFQADAFQEDAFQTTPELVIELGAAEAAALGADELNAVDLADRVIQYWRPRL